MKSLAVGLGVILIGLAIFFGNAKVCNSQNAWVLWHKTLPPGLHEWWEIINGFPSFKDCKEAQGSLCRSYARFNKERDLVDNCPDIIDFQRNGKAWTYEFKCLPDTVDPRK